MFNWNPQMRGAGFPMHPQQMMPFSGMQQTFPTGLPFQGAVGQQNWAQQQANFQPMQPQPMGMMMGSPWMAPGVFQNTGYPQEQMAMSGMMGGVNPMPPSHPPPEEKPPLPADPPPPPLPSEKPPIPQDQGKPPMPGQIKSKWDQPTKEPVSNNQFKPSVNAAPPVQPQPPRFPPPNQPEPPPESSFKQSPMGMPPPDPTLLAELERVNKDQQLFLEQYKQWKKQYDDWREENQNHPNKDQFQQYLLQWQTYEQQMEVRRKTIEVQKQSLEERLSKTSYGSSMPRATDEYNMSSWDSGKMESSQAQQAFNRPNPVRDNEQTLARNSDASLKGGNPFLNNEKKLDGTMQGKPGQFSNIREQVSASPSRQIKIPGIGDDDNCVEDMNLDEDENAVGGIIESREQTDGQVWPSGGPQDSASGPPDTSSYPGAGTNDWNSWNQGPGPNHWNNQGDGFGPDYQAGPVMNNNFQDGPQPGPNFQGGPRPGPDFQGGPSPEFFGGPGPGPGFRGGHGPGPFRGGPGPGPNFRGGPGPNFRGGPRPSPGFRGGPGPGPDFCGGPGPDFNGPRFPNRGGLQGPPDNFRGRGDWNSMRGSGPRFGRGGPGMNEGPRFPGPTNDETDYQEENSFSEIPIDESATTDYGCDADYQDDQFFSGPGADRGRGRGGLQRGRGDFQRGGMDADLPLRGGSDFQRGRGGDRGRGDFQVGPGGDSQRGGKVMGFEMDQGGEFQRGRGGDFQRGRGGEFQRGRGGEFQRGRGGDFHRGRGGMFSEGLDSNFFDAEEGPVRGGLWFRGRGRGQPPPLRPQPPSLLEVSFDESVRERFPDLDPELVGQEDQNYEDEPYEAGLGFPGDDFRDDDFRPMAGGRGRGRGGFPGPIDAVDIDFNAPLRGRGLPRGRGLMDRGRGAARPRGGFNNEQVPEDFSRGPRGRGRRLSGGPGGFNEPFMEADAQEEMFQESFRGRGRGAGRGFRGRGGGFFESQNVDPVEDFHEGPYRGRGQGPQFGRGRGRGVPAAPWSMEGDAENPPHANDLGLEEGNSSGPPRGQEPPQGPLEGEPEAKKSRFEPEIPIDTDRRGKPPFPPFPRDPFDPYLDPYADPYRRFPDPYYRDPFLDPPYGGYDRVAYDRFGGLPPRFELERKPFIPAESIDYGHGGIGKEKKSAQPAEVIDYGHGQASEKKSAELPLSVLERERGGIRDVDAAEVYRERNKNTGGSREWSDSRDYRDADYRETYPDRGSRDMDLRSRDPAGPSGFRFGGDKADVQPSSYRPKVQADEDMRYGQRGVDAEPKYRERLSGEGNDYLSERGRYGARGDDRRGPDFTGGGSDPVSSKMDERIPYARGDDSYGSRRDEPRSDYLRLHEEDVRGGRGHTKDSGLSSRDNYPRDPYSREDKGPYSRNDRDPYSRDDKDPYSRDDKGPYSRDDRDPYSRDDRDPYSRDERDPYSRDDRDPYRGERYGRIPSPLPGTPPSSASLLASTVSEVVKIEDILCPPARLTRPPQIVVIIRGLPGSGKTYVSKLIREKETSYGGSAPRMLCLDDYFMVEADREVIDPDTGKKGKKKVMEYEYEQALEEAYRQSLLKSFKKTVDDGFFPFIILDATNEKVAHFSEFWSYAKSKGFQVYVGELKADTATCIQRNIHHWTEWDIEKVKTNWEPLPCHYITLDLRWILQEDSIPEVVMEDTETSTQESEEKKAGQEEEEDDPAKEEGIYVKSKWELDTSEETLDKLDGIRVSKKHILEHQSLNEYLQLDQMDDEYNTRESLPGKKRVRWADLEEKKIQNHRRNLGFIVGQTQQDWDRITDDDFASKALNQTKYFYKS